MLLKVFENLTIIIKFKIIFHNVFGREVDTVGK